MNITWAHFMFTVVLVGMLCFCTGYVGGFAMNVPHVGTAEDMETYSDAMETNRYCPTYNMLEKVIREYNLKEVTP